MENVLEMLEGSAAVYPDKVAFSDPDGSITFKELSDRVKKVSTYFLSKGCMDAKQQNNAVLFYMEKSVDSLTAMFCGVGCWF